MTSNDDETFIIETGVAKGIDALLNTTVNSYMFG